MTKTKITQAQDIKLLDDENADVSAIAVEKNAGVSAFEVTDEVIDFSKRLGINIYASRTERLDQVARDITVSYMSLVSAGVNLLILKKEARHGEFLKELESRGIPARTAQESMVQARFILNLPADRRDKMLEIPKTKVLALANADPEVLQDLFENEEDFKDTTALSVRELRLRIRELQAQKTNMEVELEEAENSASVWREKAETMQEARVKTGGAVPIVVQDTRLECASLHKKAELSVDDIGRLVEELLANPGTFGEFEVPVARNLNMALKSIEMMASGCRARLAQEFNEVLDGEITTADVMTPDERLQAAAEFKALTGEHAYDKELREWEREMERPMGRGRPKNKPEKK